MKYFIDTNICIYFLKGKSQTIKEKFLKLHPRDIKIPAIVKAELFYGVEISMMKKANNNLLNNFLFPFEIVPFDNTAAEIYAKLRFDLEKSGKVIGPNDLIIASIVLASNGTLVTNNIKEFKRVKKLRVVNWVK